ncbi:MAG TPA: metal-dependent transcriptional regulator [Saprospiraceae bacterium]|nr:metal-dependent transcriptional regulator [Saprospiraceae bacterium]
MELSYAEENYLKAMIKLAKPGENSITTNALANHLGTTAPSVTDMLKKLSDKHLITYERYYGASLTEEGLRLATSLIRKHRLWEVFLNQTLGMPWDEIHEIAEELEHIQSDYLIDSLDKFLGNPKFDPHGDPIPNAQGKYTVRSQVPLADLQVGQTGKVVGVKDDNNTFLRHLSGKGIELGKSIHVLAKDAFDQSITFSMDDHRNDMSGLAARNILVKPM